MPLIKSYLKGASEPKLKLCSTDHCFSSKPVGMIKCTHEREMMYKEREWDFFTKVECSVRRNEF